MPLDDDDTRDAAARAAQHAQAAATSAGLAAGAAAEVLGVVAEAAVERSRELVRDTSERLPTPLVLEGVLEEAFDRGSDAWDALRGRTPKSRRWPWATGSALAGAAAAVAVTVLVRRLATRDAPGAQEPDQVQAVVDTVPAVVPTAAVVDEDGEAVEPVS